MKKLILSVLFGIFVGLSYLGLMTVVLIPFLLLIRMGFVEFMNGNILVADVVRNITGNMGDIAVEFTASSLVLIIVQVILFVTLSIVIFKFMTKVMRIHLADDSYFRHLYDGIFFSVLIIPEALIMLSIFFAFPVDITIFIILCITVFVILFAFIMTNKILPDLEKNKQRKYLLKTDSKD